MLSLRPLDRLDGALERLNALTVVIRSFPQCDPQEEVEVALPDLPKLATLREPLYRELADRLQDPEPVLPLPDKALLYE